MLVNVNGGVSGELLPRVADEIEPRQLEMICLSLNSGRWAYTGSSRLVWPRSTHRNAAMAVNSLVDEAKRKMVLSSTARASGSREMKPEVL